MVSTLEIFFLTFFLKFCRSPCDQVAGSEIRCHYNVENTIGLGAEGQCACSCFTPLTDARCPTTLGANPTHTCKGGPDDGACVVMIY